MDKENVKMGMRVVPFQKTAYGFKRDFEEYKNSLDGFPIFLKQNGFLYVSYLEEDLDVFVLSDAINGSGDYFNPEDFEPYDEEFEQQFNQQFIQNAVNVLKSKGVTPEMYEQLWKSI